VRPVSTTLPIVRCKPFVSLVFIAAALVAGSALAHHSFAVFFNEDRTVAITGEVMDFQFRNPHGVLRVIVKGKQGAKEEWRIETNSPSILRRRGWTPQSLKAGEVITVEGWPARDGSRYMRMRKVTRANGELVGQPLEPKD
jgi:hypothetical protein